MPRQREFDKREVLDRAMRLFWAQGYEATSVRDLTLAMGISTSSMYDVFGDKRGVFLEALARYCAIEQAQVMEMAHEAASPQAFVSSLFGAVNDLHAESTTPGSMAFNALVEFGTRDADVVNQLLDHYLKLAEIIADVLAQAQASGTVTSQTPPLHLAYTILSTLHGIAVMSGVKPDFAYRDAVTDLLLTLLEK
ncbi:MAG: TetR/AcrR family transcriptional regulator [Anaerolineae bacterium]|nr:TetR/AcrR family transcriptional regulator [Anaerolineae bacterium]